MYSNANGISMNAEGTLFSDIPCRFSSEDSCYKLLETLRKIESIGSKTEADSALI